MATVLVRGLDGAGAKFDSLPDVFQRRLLEALTESASYIARDAAARCPVGSPPDRHPGDLKRAIAFKVFNTRAIVGLVMDAFVRGGKNSAHQHPAVYGRFVEFGTHNMAAKPFMRPAAEVGRVVFPSSVAKAAKAAEGDLAGSGGLL